MAQQYCVNIINVKIVTDFESAPGTDNTKRLMYSKTALFFIMSCILSPLACSQNDGAVTGFGFTSLGSAEGMNERLEEQEKKIPVVTAYLSRLCELSDKETNRHRSAVETAFEEWKAKYLVLRDRLAKVQAEYEQAYSQQEPMEKLEEKLDLVYEDRAKLSLFTSSEALNSALKGKFVKGRFPKVHTGYRQPTQTNHCEQSAVARWVD